MSASSHIVLIDDNPRDRVYYADRLQATFPECVVVQATPGRTGLALCKEHRPDCVLLELDLPDPVSRCYSSWFLVYIALKWP
jgi:DNA-binding NarL/FixJ family response regulator